MSIHFACERCGHAIDVPDQLAGTHGKCKHCGHHMAVPEAHVTATGETLRLRPHEEEPARLPGHLLASEVPLTVRPSEAAPRKKPEAVSDPDEPLARTRHGRAHGDDEYRLSRSGQDEHRHSSAGPPPLWVNMPTLTARFLAGRFKTLRDWLYLVSVGSLVVVLLGYLYHSRTVLHLGAALVIASNISMLVVGIAYLVTLPFKESLWVGLANLLIPFYAIYFWVTRWPRMKRPVINTISSFLPIALVGLAYLVYEEGPAVERAVEKELPVLEEKVDKVLPELERKADRVIEPVKDTVDKELQTQPASESENDRKPPREDDR